MGPTMTSSPPFEVDTSTSGDEEKKDCEQQPPPRPPEQQPADAAAGGLLGFLAGHVVRLASLLRSDYVRQVRANLRSKLTCQPDAPPCCAGWDLVCAAGATRPAAEVVRVCGVHPPRYAFYMMSGSSCDVYQLVIDAFIHEVLGIYDSSVCWGLGFGISVALRHTSHRYLVFGDYVGGYWSSLGRMYFAYSIIIAISSAFNFVMTHWLPLTHYVAWVVTALWTGIVNYFILKRIWSFDGGAAGGAKKAADDGGPGYAAVGAGGAPSDGDDEYFVEDIGPSAPSVEMGAVAAAPAVMRRQSSLAGGGRVRARTSSSGDALAFAEGGGGASRGSAASTEAGRDLSESDRMISVNLTDVRI